MRDDSAEIFFQSFLQEATVISSGTGGDVHSDVVHPAFPRLTTASPIIQGALKDGFGEAVVACGMPESCEFLSLDSCQKRFLWTRKEVDLAPHPVAGLVLQVGDTEKFSHAFGFESLDPFFFFFSPPHQGITISANSMSGLLLTNNKSFLYSASLGNSLKCCTLSCHTNHMLALQ